MNTGIGNDYIKKALDELIPIIGVKQSINEETLIKLIEAGNIENAILRIALYLGLPIKVNLTYGNTGFKTKQIVLTDTVGKGTDSITAQVGIPVNLPFYGSDRMNGFPIDIILSNNALNIRRR